MANLNVSYDEMSTAAGQLVQGQTEIETQLSTLQKQVETLVNSGFATDQASKAFLASYEEFKSGVSQVIEGLTGMSNYLNKASSAMQDMDTQLAQALQK